MAMGDACKHTTRATHLNCAAWQHAPRLPAQIRMLLSSVSSGIGARVTALIETIRAASGIRRSDDESSTGSADSACGALPAALQVALVDGAADAAPPDVALDAGRSAGGDARNGRAAAASPPHNTALPRLRLASRPTPPPETASEEATCCCGRPAGEPRRGACSGAEVGRERRGMSCAAGEDGGRYTDMGGELRAPRGGIRVVMARGLR